MNILVANFGDIEAWTIPDAAVAYLHACVPHAHIVHARSTADILAAIGESEVAFSWRIDRHALERAGRLRWIHSPSAGIGASLLSDALRQRDIVLTNSRGINAQTVAEHALALVLALGRRLHTAIARQAQAQWAQNELTVPSPRVLHGRTLGLIGIGAIGTALARLARAFDMKIIATRRRPELPTPDGIDVVVPTTELTRLFAESDVVVIAAPETRETARLIGEREIAVMKRDAILVNVGRGALVDESALVRALTERRIGGAGLDVFADEPLPPTSPLWALPNVILTPHVAGVRADYWDVAVDMFVTNLRRFEAGEPLLWVVDKHAGY